jgi:hypothetical protein
MTKDVVDVFEVIQIHDRYSQGADAASHRLQDRGSIQLQ